MGPVTNPLTVLEAEIRYFCDADAAAKTKVVLAERAKSMDMSDVRYTIWLLKIADDAVDLVSHLPLPDDRAKRIIADLTGFQEKFLTACRTALISEMVGKIGTATPDLISAWADVVSAAGIVGELAFDREALSKVTLDLISRVEKSEIVAYQ